MLNWEDRDRSCHSGSIAIHMYTIHYIHQKMEGACKGLEVQGEHDCGTTWFLVDPGPLDKNTNRREKRNGEERREKRKERREKREERKDGLLACQHGDEKMKEQRRK